MWDKLQAVIGATPVLTDPADCWPYGYDNSQRHVLPQAVVFPDSTQAVQQVVRFCITHRMPLTARGRGSGTPGGSVPLAGGVVLSTERLTHIGRVDVANRMITVQPGATNQVVQQIAAASGFFWAPDPTSQAVATIGGNLAYNSAGPRAVKYGTPRENTLGLTVVTGTGEIIHTGGHTTKGVVGYDLTRLMIGSEGTLGIITEAILRLQPLPEAKQTIQAWYSSVESATEAIVRVMSQPHIPCALEWMDSTAIDLLRAHTNLAVPTDARSLLMIEVDGAIESLPLAVAKISTAATTNALCHLATADTSATQQELWQARKSLSPLLRWLAPKKINEDVVVPVSAIPTLVQFLNNLSKTSGIPIVNFGHAGNGNIHVNLLIQPEQQALAQQILPEIFDEVARLRGMISGEHGIGIDKKPFLLRTLSPAHVEIMRGIKNVLDPYNILNPGKIF